MQNGGFPNLELLGICCRHAKELHENLVREAQSNIGHVVALTLGDYFIHDVIEALNDLWAKPVNCGGREQRA